MNRRLRDTVANDIRAAEHESAEIGLLIEKADRCSNPKLRRAIEVEAQTRLERQRQTVRILARLHRN